METGFIQNSSQLKPRQSLIKRMLANQSAKIISEYKRLIITDKIPVLDIYQPFYAKIIQQAEEAFIKVYETELRQRKISVEAALLGMINHFKDSSQFIWAQLTKEQQQQRMNNKQPKLIRNSNICQKCEKLIAFKNIQLEKARIQTGQFDDPFSLFCDGKMNFQDDQRPEDEQPLQYMENQKQIYAQINCLKQRITKRTTQILDFLNQLHKYTDQSNLFPDKDKNKNQQNVLVFDACMRSVVEIIEEKVLQVLRKLKKQKKAKGLYKMQSYAQVGNSFNQFLELQKKIVDLEKQLQEKNKQLKNFRNYVDSLQQKLQRNFIELSSVKFRNTEVVQENAKTKSQLQTEKRQHKRTARRLSQRQKQVESLFNQLILLRQQKQGQGQRLDEESNPIRSNNKKATYKKRGVSPPQTEKKTQKSRHTVKAPSVTKGLAQKQNQDEQRWELPQQFGIGMSSLLFVQKPRRQSRMRTTAKNQDNERSIEVEPILSKTRQFNSKRQITQRAEDNIYSNTSSSLISLKSKNKLQFLSKIDQVKSKQSIQITQSPQKYELTSERQDQNQIMNLKSFRVIKNVQISENIPQSIQYTYEINNQNIQNLINNKLNINIKNPIKQTSLQKQSKPKDIKLQRITVPGKDAKYKTHHVEQQGRMASTLPFTNTKSTIGKNKKLNKNFERLQSLQDRKERPSADNIKTMQKLSTSTIRPKKYQNQPSQFSSTSQTVYVNNPIFESTLTKQATEKLSLTLPLCLNKNRLNTQQQLYQKSLFTVNDVTNLYFCVEGAIEHEKSKKSTYKQAQILKAEQYKFLTKILTLIAAIHITNPYYYQSIKNLLLSPFQSIVSQQNFIVIRKSTFNQIRIKQALIKVISLHKNCNKENKQKNGKNCEHIQKLVKKLQNLYKQDKQDMIQNDYNNTITQKQQDKQQQPNIYKDKLQIE